jgi:O-glycosyl hydrolase
MRCAFNIKKDGSLEILKGYYYYKQVTRAGQPGMTVAQVVNLDPSIGVIAFSSNQTVNKDSFVIINKSDKTKKVSIQILGSLSNEFSVFRTSYSEDYKGLGEIAFANGQVNYECPSGSVTTFFGK